MSKGAASERVCLIADDNREIRALIVRALTARGWRVHACSDGLSAIQILDEYRVDAVIADIIMRGTSGTRLLEYARSIYPQARLVVMSGWVDSFAAVHADRLGAAILRKPFSSAELYQAIEGPPDAA